MDHVTVIINLHLYGAKEANKKSILHDHFFSSFSHAFYELVGKTSSSSENGVLIGDCSHRKYWNVYSEKL